MAEKIIAYFGEKKYEAPLTSFSWVCKENKKIVIPKNVTLLELSHVDLLSFNQIVLENSDTWLLLDHCYFEGAIVGGNVSLYPNGNRKDDSITFMDNQEVEIIFPEKQKKHFITYGLNYIKNLIVQGNVSLYPNGNRKDDSITFMNNQEVEIIFPEKQKKRFITYGFHHVKNLTVQGNAALSNFITLSSIDEFSLEHAKFSHVNGGNISWMTIRNMEVVDSILNSFHLAKGEKLRIINSDILSCERMPLDPIQMDLLADEVELIDSGLHSQAFHFKNFVIQEPLILHDEKTKTKRKNENYLNQLLLFRDDCSNENGNLAIARAKFVCAMQASLQIAKNRLEQLKNEDKKKIIGNYSIPFKTQQEWILGYISSLDEAKIKKDEILFQMSSEIKKNNDQVELLPIGRVLKREEPEEKA